MLLWSLKCKAEDALETALFTSGMLSNGKPQQLQWKFGSQLWSRYHFPLLLNALGLKGEGVEIGVFQGAFSEHLLKHSRLSQLYSIDPWREQSREAYDDSANVEQQILDTRYEMTCERLKKYAQRSSILRMTSEEAVDRFAPESLDFIYIDGNHSYEGCLHDLELWWPKLRAGGLIAGDDYVDGDIAGTDFGVISATGDFFSNKSESVQTTRKLHSDHWPNWYLIKS